MCGARRTLLPQPARISNGGRNRRISILGIDTFMVAAKADSFDEQGSEQSEITANLSRNVIRVLLADSQAIYRVGMRKIFALEVDIRWVSRGGSVARLESAAQR